MNRRVLHTGSVHADWTAQSKLSAGVDADGQSLIEIDETRKSQKSSNNVQECKARITHL